MNENTDTSDRTFKSLGIGARFPPSDGDEAGYGGSKSMLRGKIPGSRVAYQEKSGLQPTNRKENIKHPQ
jgi:hypothetical protein